MAKERSTIRQRKAGGAQEQLAAAAAAAAEPKQTELTQWQKANFYAAQHIGLVLCAIGILMLFMGYNKEWMHNTTLCMVSLGLCVVGLLFHELRPFNAQHIYEEEQKAASDAAQ